MRRFEWDSKKNELNKAKHGIDFPTAKLVFDDPLFVSFVDLIDGEERLRTIGMIHNLLLVLVAHTDRDESADEIVRIISARRATKHERTEYDKANRPKA